MKVIGLLPPREIEGADMVNQGAVLEASSGNHCYMWPWAKNESEPGKITVCFYAAWRDAPTEEDLSEARDMTKRYMSQSRKHYPVQ